MKAEEHLLSQKHVNARDFLDLNEDELFMECDLTWDRVISDMEEYAYLKGLQSRESLLKVEQELEEANRTIVDHGREIRAQQKTITKREEEIAALDKTASKKISELEETISQKDAKLEAILKGLREIQIYEAISNQDWVHEVLLNVKKLLNEHSK